MRDVAVAVFNGMNAESGVALEDLYREKEPAVYDPSQKWW